MVASLGRTIHDPGQNTRAGASHRRLLRVAVLATTTIAACELSPLHLGHGLEDATNRDGDSDGWLPGLGGAGGSAEPAATVCNTSSSGAEIRRAYLAFALDVSGSMGKLDCPFWNHDPWLKWRPMVDAVQAFFEDPSSNGLSASLALFPAATQHCELDSYSVPDVEMMLLPSLAFTNRLKAYEAEVGLDDYSDPMPEGGGNWRGGTPTLAVFSAMHEQLAKHQTDDQEARHAVVLVTDGMPQGCGDDAQQLSTLLDLCKPRDPVIK